MKIISSKHNKNLASNICNSLECKIADVDISNFPNGEYKIQIKENVKAENCVIINSLSIPTHENIFQLMLLTDALSHLKPHTITAIIPWLAYSPQDKIFREGEPLSSKMLISSLENLPIDKFVIFDVHSPLVLKFFNKPITELSALPLFINYIKSNLNVESDNWIVVSLDEGSRQRSLELSRSLELDMLCFNKERDRVTGEIQFTKFPTGLHGKNILIVDDFISTGSSLVKAIDFLKSNGVLDCHCFVTHCVTKEGADNVLQSKIDKLIITNSINYKEPYNEKLEILDLSPTIVTYLQNNYK